MTTEETLDSTCQLPCDDLVTRDSATPDALSESSVTVEETTLREITEGFSQYDAMLRLFQRVSDAAPQSKSEQATCDSAERASRGHSEELATCRSTEKVTRSSTEVQFGADHLKAMSAQLLHYRRTGFLCDTVLITGNKGVRAHGILLAAASPVLAAALWHQAGAGGGGWGGREGGERLACYLSLPEYDLETLRAAIQFIYTGILVAPGSWVEDSSRVLALKVALKRLGLDAGRVDQCSVSYREAAGESSSTLGQSGTGVKPGRAVTLDPEGLSRPAAQFNGQAASKVKALAVRLLDVTEGGQEGPEGQGGQAERVVGKLPCKRVRTPRLSRATKLRSIELNRPSASEWGVVAVIKEELEEKWLVKEERGEQGVSEAESGAGEPYPTLDTGPKAEGSPWAESSQDTWPGGVDLSPVPSSAPTNIHPSSTSLGRSSTGERLKARRMRRWQARVDAFDRSCDPVSADHPYSQASDCGGSRADNVRDAASDVAVDSCAVRVIGPTEQVRVESAGGTVPVVAASGDPLLYSSVSALEQGLCIMKQDKVAAVRRRKREDKCSKAQHAAAAAQGAAAVEHTRMARLRDKRTLKNKVWKEISEDDGVEGNSEGDGVEGGTGAGKATRKYACDECPHIRVFATKQGLGTHVRMAHGVQTRRVHQCDVCGKVVKSAYALRNHTRTHAGERPHTCPHCGRAFSSEPNMRRHALTHGGARPHLCEQCGRGFIQRQSLLDHVAHHHSTRSWTCNLCAPPARSDPGLREEIGPPQGLVSFKCRREYVKHCEMAHGFTPSKFDRPNDGPGVLGEGGWLCDVCGRSFPGQKGLRKHKSLVHGVNGITRGLVCGACAERFPSHALLEGHVRAVHGAAEPEGSKAAERPWKHGGAEGADGPGKQEGSGRAEGSGEEEKLGGRPKETGGRLGDTGGISEEAVGSVAGRGDRGCEAVRPVCERCGAVFVSVEALETHRADKLHRAGIHRPDYSSERGGRGPRGRRPGGASRGSRDATRGVGGWGVGEHACKVCERRFVSQRRLDMHYRWHQGLAADTHTGYEYPCPECDTVCSNSQSLRLHSVVHTGEKPYACKQCERRFSFARTLLVHERMHTGEKPYTCTVCAKTFRQAGHLRHHSLLHSGVRPHSCTLCDKSYRQRVDLRTHYTRAHGVSVTAQRVNASVRYTIQLPGSETGS